MANSDKISKAREAFVDYLRDANMRITSERLSVVEVISKHATLFTVDELHTLMAREAFPVSVATIYNTIDLLIDAGLVQRLRLPDRHTALFRLDLDDKPHVYLVCQQCGAIKECSPKTLTRYIRDYAYQAFTPKSFALVVDGICKKCNKNDKQ